MVHSFAVLERVPIIVGFVSLTNPLLLGGLALLSFPVLAHFLNRFARRRIVFPSIQLLQEVVASESRLLKLRRWLLLLLRCLMVTALVAAFTRPIWLQSPEAAAAVKQGNAVVVVLDISASMRLEHDGISSMERAKGAASRVLSQLRPGQDVAEVVFASSEPYAVFEQLSPNLPALAAQIKVVQATFEAADGPAACRLAGRLLKTHQGPRRIVLVSDLQATNWNELASAARLREWLPEGTRVTVVDLEPNLGQNVSLGRPRSFPAQPLAEQPIEFIVQVRNGTDAQKEVRLSATVNNQRLADQRFVLSGKEQRDATFSHHAHAAGVQAVTFRIDQDALRCDNECHLALYPVKQLKVVIVTDDDPQRIGSAAYFVSRALAPFHDESDRHEITYLSSAELSTDRLRRAAAVFVGYLGQLTPNRAQALAAYVRQGGGLVVFCGEGGVRRNLLVLNDLDPDGFLPWHPGPRVDLAQSDGAVIAGGKWRSPLLRDFDEASQISLGTIRFATLWHAQEVRPDAEVLLSYQDGTPALATRQVERGQIVMANFSPSAESSDLAKHGAFVALMQMLVKNLQTDRDEGQPGYVGQSQIYEIAGTRAATNLQVEDPRGEAISASIAVRETSTLVQLNRPKTPGIYRIRLGDETVGAFAVNVDPRESDLRAISLAELEETLAQFGGNDSRSTNVTANASEAIQLRGQPLWGWLVALSMTLAATELCLLGWWRR